MTRRILFFLGLATSLGLWRLQRLRSRYGPEPEKRRSGERMQTRTEERYRIIDDVLEHIYEDAA
jgi:hypothetical protein